MVKKAVCTFDNFDLRKVKITDNKVEVSYYNLEDKNTEENPKSDNHAHPKLIIALGEFSEIFAKAQGSLKGWEAARQFGRTDIDPGGALEQAVKGYNECVENHHVSGLIYSGERFSGITITGSIKNDLGSIGQATKQIVFEKHEYGHDASVKADNVRERVYAFLFKGEFVAPEDKPKKKKKEKEAEVDPAQTSLLDEDQQGG